MSDSVRAAAPPVRILDLHPPRGDFCAEVVAGLSARPKMISPKYFYDERGSHLFDDITRLPEYYPTRTELAIMDTWMSEIASLAGADACVIEFGPGSGLKTRKLIEGLESPVAYVPVEISREHLINSAQALADDFDDLEVLPVCADFTQPFELPTPAKAPARNLVYFPGSTIGNFTDPAAEALLEVMHMEAGAGGALLIGVDLRKDRDILEKAYNDSASVTAEFNLNLLHRMNRELGTDFAIDRFEHRAVWDDRKGRIEMRLKSLAEQTVTVAGRQIGFAAGEDIVTEYSRKYELEEFAGLAARAGFHTVRVWSDEDRLFSIHYLEGD
jgi:L-histidine N-alpha-methyltransferase